MCTPGEIRYPSTNSTKKASQRTLNNALLQLGLNTLDSQAIETADVLQLFVQEVAAAIDFLYQASMLVQRRQGGHGRIWDSLMPLRGRSLTGADDDGYGVHGRWEPSLLVGMTRGRDAAAVRVAMVGIACRRRDTGLEGGIGW